MGKFIRVLMCLIVSGIFLAPLDSGEAAPLAEEQRLDFISGQVLVKLKPQAVSEGKVSAAAIEDLFDGYGVTGGEPVFRGGGGVRATTAGGMDLARIYKLYIPPEADVLATVSALQGDPNVEWAEPDYIARAIAVPNDPLYSSQWGLTKIQAANAWDIETGSSDVVVAVLDSGVDLDHADLSGRLWTNPGEVAGNGVDDDNNGYIDDVNGWDFVNNDKTPDDDYGHGTLTAGISTAATNNGQGVAGVCWDCRIMAVKVMNASGTANYSDIAAGVVYAAEKGAEVINLGLGGYSDSATLKAAIQSASATAVVVAGAGNDDVSTPFYPAAYDGYVLADAATTNTDTKAGFSNYGTYVDISAPGDNIDNTAMGGGYTASSGTSMSTPFVSGLAALLRSHNPAWSSNLVRAQIIHTTDNIDSLNPGYAGKLGSGRINAYKALNTTPQPELQYVSYVANGETNGRPAPGSTVNLVVHVQNLWKDATNVVGTLSTSDSYVTITDNSANFSNIGTYATGSNSGDSFVFFVSASCPYAHSIDFTLHLTANGGSYSVNLPFTVTTASGTQDVSGVLSSNTTWTNDKTYVVTGNILVPNGVTLTIEPGTVVKFDGFYNIQVEGQLIAAGTESNMIVFTSNKTTPTVTDWHSILFKDSSVDATLDANFNYVSGSIIRYCEFSYGGPVVAADYSSPFIANNYIHDTGNGGPPRDWPSGTIWLHGLPPTVTIVISNVIENNTNSGICVAYGTAKIIGNLIRNNTSRWGGGIGIFSRGPVTMEHNTIVSNTAGEMGGAIGIYRGNHTIRYNLIANNSCIVDQYKFTNKGGGAIGKWGSIISVTDNTILGNAGFAAFHYNNTSLGDAIEQNNIAGTNPYIIYLGQYGTQNVSASNNYWDTINTAEIDAQIYDYYDDFNLGKVNYTPIRTAPISTLPGFLWNISLSPASPVGIEQVTFNLTFSRPMDQSIDPIVAFGATSPYNTYQVTDNAQWLDDSHWQAAYDITSMVPKGTYTISVSGPKGTDGMEIPTDTRFGFTVDYAGAINDTTPPSAPIVYACAQNNTTTLEAQWLASDPESAIVEYQYAIGTAPGAVDVVSWTSTGTDTSVTKTDLNLTYGHVYYVSARARNEGGLWSAVGVSSGVSAGTVCPNVAFTASPTTGRAPLAVQFTNQSTGSIASYSWQFGDGGTSMEASPVYTYITSGVFTVTLQATGPGGTGILIKPSYISVEQPGVYLPLILKSQ